jgi:hypothetical protein
MKEHTTEAHLIKFALSDLTEHNAVRRSSRNYIKDLPAIDAESVDVLLEGASLPNWESRELALFALGRSKYTTPKILETLDTALCNPKEDPMVRIMAALGLQQNQSQQSVSILANRISESLEGKRDLDFPIREAFEYLAESGALALPHLNIFERFRELTPHESETQHNRDYYILRHRLSETISHDFKIYKKFNGFEGRELNSSKDFFSSIAPSVTSPIRFTNHTLIDDTRYNFDITNILPDGEPLTVTARVLIMSPRDFKQQLVVLICQDEFTIGTTINVTESIGYKISRIFDAPPENLFLAHHTNVDLNAQSIKGNYLKVDPFYGTILDSSMEVEHHLGPDLMQLNKYLRTHFNHPVDLPEFTAAYRFDEWTRKNYHRLKQSLKKT